MINDLDKFLESKTEKRIVFLTGAGLSKESGISTFRDAEDGLWNNHKIDKVCNIGTFYVNYELSHEFYNQRRVDLESVHPNIAHKMIANLQHKYQHRVMHITANVDDLVERAGGAAMHVHGNLKQMIEYWGEENEHVIDIGYNKYDLKMGIIAKPAVVFFGEAQRYEDGIKKPIYDEMFAVIDSLTANDVVIVIGSSDTVIPWSYYLTGKECTKININPQKIGNIEAFDIDVRKPCTEAVDDLLIYLEQHMSE